MPWAEIPSGRMVELPGRGSTYVTDTAGPDPDSPAVVLLHAVGTTGLLTWFPTIPVLSTRFRVITLDQRWHGRGIRSAKFSLSDSADDVAALLDVLGIERAIIGGFSMGSIIAQRTWRQHPDRVAGLVLAATTDRFRGTVSERLFHQAMETSMAALRGVSRSRVAGQVAVDVAAHDPVPVDIHDWALAEFRSTSPWAVAHAVASLGRHHSRPWLRRINVPTAVVVTLRDKVIPAARQLDLARRIPGATIHGIDAGHASVVMEAEVFVPAFVEACTTVHARAADFAR
ncbi:pimeloyl-ACP methyl ester carboxylesterase [Nocardioides daedukensis]|uniref:Pimeloyl-ACP methyl ester carboxylesterase n=1 Tax=Nocardioides daedukensis TaxID=634462 RepID=A0A7Y9UT94_9ACTN|nr:alpha/beta fold hydrolase [Nocardioides daedukensis]NYG57599.1 pimeloyl-ACP methyl ester carboxylesterase [Nocardioides daedukensis]